MRKHYLLVSDFDQTLSFNDSGLVLSEMLGITGFQDKVANLARLNLVQEGAELTYLLRHDPEFRRVRRDDLIEVGHRIRLKRKRCENRASRSRGFHSRRLFAEVRSRGRSQTILSVVGELRTANVSRASR